MLYKKIQYSFQFKEEFVSMGCDYYSREGYKFLANYFNSQEEKEELDVLSITRQISEFGFDCNFSFSAYIKLHMTDKEALEMFHEKIFDHSGLHEAIAKHARKNGNIILSNDNIIVIN